MPICHRSISTLLDFVIKWNTNDVINNFMFPHATTIPIEKNLIHLLMVSCFKLFFSLTKSTHTCLSSSLSFSRAFSSSAWALVDHNEALSNFKLCTSQLGTFVVVVEGDCERGMDPLGITTSSPIEWKRISLADSLTTSVDEGAVAIEGAWMDFEIEPFFNTHLHFFGQRNHNLKGFRQLLLLHFTQIWKSYVFFSSSVTIGGRMCSWPRNA